MSTVVKLGSVSRETRGFSTAPGTPDASTGSCFDAGKGQVIKCTNATTEICPETPKCVH